MLHRGPLKWIFFLTENFNTYYFRNEKNEIKTICACKGKWYEKKISIEYRL